MKRQTKLTSREELQHTESAAQSAQEFASVDDLLRFDADHAALPADIERRLRESLRGLPQPQKPWWKRLFSE